jgi:hypothetical protein
MRKKVAVLAVAGIVALSTSGVRSASADPANRCYGEIIAAIVATWPWAHEGQTAFAPPPGAIALWLELFGPDLGISSVRDLQLLFCSS